MKAKCLSLEVSTSTVHKCEFKYLLQLGHLQSAKAIYVTLFGSPPHTWPGMIG